MKMASKFLIKRRQSYFSSLHWSWQLLVSLQVDLPTDWLIVVYSVTLTTDQSVVNLEVYVICYQRSSYFIRTSRTIGFLHINNQRGPICMFCGWHKHVSDELLVQNLNSAIQIVQTEKEAKRMTIRKWVSLKTNSSPGCNTRLLPDKHSTSSYNMARTSLHQLQDGLAAHVVLTVCWLAFHHW